MPAMSPEAATRPFVSREAELATLRSALERGAAGRTTTVLVTGDAGVGKSRLVAELAAGADAQGALVLMGNCVELAEGELPYAPVAGALRSMAAQLEPAALDDVLGPARAEMARLVPDLGEASETVPRPGSFATARLFELLLGVLARAGARTPVLLVIEDLHWADGSTRDLLRFLVRSSSAERLTIVVTCRLDDLHRAHPLRPYAAELARDPRVDQMALRQFSRAEFADHVAAILGVLPSAAVLDALYERSEGNPFFTEELLAAGGPGAPHALPASLQDALLANLARLSDPTQRVVRVLAAAGRRVDYELLAAVAGTGEEELTETLREAVVAQVLVPRDSAYEFRHALLREAAYTELLPGEREQLHAQLAEELDARSARATGGATLHAELAHHWQAAGEPDRALPASVRAGHEAARAYAYPEALRQFQRALELWERVTSDARAGLDLVEISGSAAAAAMAAGESELAIALCGRAIESVDGHAEPLRASVLRARLARCFEEAGRGDEARQQSAQAVAMLPAEATPERAQVLEAHARLLLLGARIEEAREPIEEAIATARALGLRDVEAEALTTRVITMHGRTEEAMEAGQAALLAARDGGDLEILVRAHVNAAEALEQAGRLEQATGLAREGVEVARRAGVERVRGAQLKADSARRLVKLGRLEQAQEEIAEALRGAPVGLPAATLHQTAATIAAHRGDADRAESSAGLARAHTLDAGGGMWNARGAAAMAEVELWRGEAGRACEVVDEALAEVGEAEFLFYSAPLYALGAWAHADVALRDRALGRHSEAEQARGAIVALGERFDSRLVDTAPPELAAYCAQLSAELGRLEELPDARAWEEGRGMWDALGFPFEKALCAWREAEALLGRDRERGRAAELLGVAHAGAEALAAQPLLAQVEGLARRARVPLAQPSDIDSAAVDIRERTGLSPREMEVLALVAEGRTNREIGAELFISQKTVSVHVSRILAKLGAANRAQAATIAHRLGLPAA